MDGGSCCPYRPSLGPQSPVNNFIAHSQRAWLIVMDSAQPWLVASQEVGREVVEGQGHLFHAACLPQPCR